MRIDRNGAGYRTKAEYVVKCLAENGAGLRQRSGYRDGEWFLLGRAYNVGGSLLLWMVENGFLERRHNRGNSVQAFLCDWYRVPVAPADVDLGDWWIE